MSGSNPNTSLLTGVAIAVTAVWIMTMWAGIFQHNYDPLKIVSPIMLIVAGRIMGVEIRVRRTNNGNVNGERNGNGNKELH